MALARYSMHAICDSQWVADHSLLHGSHMRASQAKWFAHANPCNQACYV